MSNEKKGSLLLQAASFIYPRKCVSCGNYISNEKEDFCLECKAGVFRTKAPYCPYCGVGKEYCSCRKNSHAYEMAIAPFYYEGSIKKAIGRMKFGKKEGVSRFFGMEITKDIEMKYFGIDFDIITCVPSTTKSIRERGFNQSASILESINIEEDKKDYSLLTKKPQKDIQHMLGAEKRRENVSNTYFLSEGRIVKDKNILLIDDILTTGATADACTRTLMFNGAMKVYVAVAAFDIVKND